MSCTEEEYVQMTKIKDEALISGEVNTQKQAIKLAKDRLKNIYKQQKQDEESAKQQVISARVQMFAKLNIQCGSDGYPENTPDSYRNFLINYPNLEKIRLDEFSDTIYYGDVPLDDILESVIANKIDNVCHLSSPYKLRNVINEVALTNKFNSLRDVLDELVWDKKKRLNTLFHSYLGAPKNKLYGAMSTIWCVAAVKRVYEPGCKFDNMIILQGPQGIGKSMFCERLAMQPQWYVENVPIGDKDALIQIRTSWLVNMDEITSLNKKDAATAKNFITSSVDNYRSPFERHSKEHRRHCVFIGTTNEDTFLKDSTAVVERRYWVVPCSGTREDSFVRFNSLDADTVKQIWAEAVYYYKNGQIDLYIPNELWDEFAESQIQYKSEDDSELFTFLDDALNRTYVDFVNDNSLTNQYKMSGSISGVQKMQDTFSLNSLRLLLKDNHIYDWKGCFKQYAAMRKDEWEYTVYKQKGKAVRGLKRKTPSEQTPIEDNPNSIFEV